MSDSSAAARCHACLSPRIESFYRIESVPVHSVLLMRSRDEAIAYPRGSIDLAVCRDCAFIQNSAFDPAVEDFSESYEETQAFSPRFREFASELATRLNDRYALEGKRILEIGCGKGDFLVTLARTAGASAIGIDPAFVPGRADTRDADVSFIRDVYENRTERTGWADLIVCRHTLEHIREVRELLARIRDALGTRIGVPLYFEVPDTARLLEEQAFWDVYYEHCSYFTRESIARLFESTGYEILSVTTGFGDQYLLVEAQSAGGESRAPRRAGTEAILAAAHRFGEAVRQRVGRWRDELESLASQGRRVILWGSGSKAVSFLCALGDRASAIESVVDINPYRQGTFVAGTGHPIVGPEHLESARPDVVVIMNPVYGAEIRDELRRRGASPRIMDLD